MDEPAPYVLDRLVGERRAKFDNNLARVIAKALEKRVEQRYQGVDEMHEAIYACLIDRGEAVYRFSQIIFGLKSSVPILLFPNQSSEPASHIR